MHDCQFKTRLSAYHDAELSAADIEAVNEHLPTCATCSAELAALRDVSSALSTYEPGQISQIELARLHRAIDRADDRGLLRLAGMLATVAASVLIICMAWMSQTPTSSPVANPHAGQRVQGWENLALGGQPETPGVPDDLSTSGPHDTGVAIDFMLHGIQGLSGNESR